MVEIPEHVLRNIRGVRTITARHLGRPAKGLCRWCLKPVSGRRRTWCSDKCSNEFYELQLARGYAVERDKGICGACGKDTNQDQKILNEVCLLWQRVTLMHGRVTAYYKLLPDHQDIQHYQEAKALLIAYSERFPDWFTMERSEAEMTQPEHIGAPRLKRKHAGEVDHVIPIKKMGTSTLDNLVWLCTSCHVAKTAREAGEAAMTRARAKRRDPEQPKKEKKKSWPSRKMQSRPFPKKV